MPTTVAATKRAMTTPTRTPTGHGDLNLRSAYVHVAADAATSLLAIGALAGGKYLKVGWLDAAVGLFASVVVAAWAWSLLRSTGRILLDAEMDAPVVARIREILRCSPVPAEIHDLHVWRVGKGNYACILGVDDRSAGQPRILPVDARSCGELVHVTVEVNPARRRCAAAVASCEARRWRRPGLGYCPRSRAASA